MAARNPILLLAFVACLLLSDTKGFSQQNITNHASIQNNDIRLSWIKADDGWRLQQAGIRDKYMWTDIPHVKGEYTFLYSPVNPDTIDNKVYYLKGDSISFPEEHYKKIMNKKWQDVISPVQMNTAGITSSFYPSTMLHTGDNELVFTKENHLAMLTCTWKLDKTFSTDVLVRMVLQAKEAGYYSLCTPDLAAVSEDELAWGVIPGFFQGKVIEHDFIKSYIYGQGIPDKPVLVRERTASTLTSIITAKNGVTIAVIPEPGSGRDPWEYDSITQTKWQLGLSLMNRKAELFPTAWHPVLGQPGSYLEKGDTVSFSFRYTLKRAGWYEVYKHAVNDVYRFNDFLSLKETKQSLTSRILAMHHYLLDDKTSMWRTVNVNGLTVGAQDYLGIVYESDKDAIKNSDYGAMWMLAAITKDSVLKNTRLPYARNFKIVQQENKEGFFSGAASGQYLLWKSKKFTEEFGPYVEPIGITYYMMMDIGNILLFEPGDQELEKRLRLAADRLLAWMSKEGTWAVAYDHSTKKELFRDVQDLRPTFYGFYIAYKILKDRKYLAAAIKSADWYIQHAVERGYFLGVCGDNRFVPDFATGQSVQALLDLYEITKNKKYRNAAIRTARFYTTSIYTHPIPSTKEKLVKGMKVHDWEISQSGLSFEHGGSIGSANYAGPILLASHAGLFIRMFSITGDSLFLNMARAAALGRDAFVDKSTSVASYYWRRMNDGSGPFPHHAWWQIGWITDYLLAEAALRSDNNIVFPGGFITPKVGPHRSYGFAPGTVYGTKASLLLREGLLKPLSPYADYYCAINEEKKKLFFILLNSDDEVLTTEVEIDYSKAVDGKEIVPVQMVAIGRNNKRSVMDKNYSPLQVTIPAFGIKVIEVDYKE